MDIYNESYITLFDLREYFNTAARKGRRYVAVVHIEQHGRRHILARDEVVLMTNDAMDVVRYLREKGLRPDNNMAVLKRFFDTRAGDDAFAQARWSPPTMIRKYMPADAHAAYERFVQAQADMQARAKAQVEKKGGFFSR